MAKKNRKCSLPRAINVKFSKFHAARQKNSAVSNSVLINEIKEKVDGERENKLCVCVLTVCAFLLYLKC